ncbi:hypothetical protein C8E00_103165 [Chromohalobacter marismortui]|uniref:PDZ domain-containing protein n=1 Tax=Chromohalobacter marismortui TaxID=42055 RepID=A0A4R7NPJ8_9GAMM|nr:MULTISPECIES: hypothetical protein [Chromohalobacter]MCI0508824.1 hypothetical protein [Chromohalobacter sp.]MCI0594319.1 hypothetical protein [Chromohalobacter sp.]TDU22803.1 hypothetical protein C8E00_103165 [Chromohalobacter marismortui]
MRAILRSQLFIVVLWGVVMATLPYTTYKMLLFQRQAPSLLSEHVVALMIGNIAMTVILIAMLLLVTSAHSHLRQGHSRPRGETPPSAPPNRRPAASSAGSPRSKAPQEDATATPTTGLQLVDVDADSPLQSRLPLGAVIISVNGTTATSLAAAESVLKPGVNELDWLDDAGKRNMAYVMVHDGKLHAELQPI